MAVTQIRLYPPDSSPLGLSFGYWSVKWWQWLLAIPKSKSPVFDSSGINSGIGQYSSDIFFLCQTMEGAIPTPNRRVRLKKGTSIFMPVINWISIAGKDGYSDHELLETAKRRMDSISNLELKINGERLEHLEKYRFQSPFFNVFLPNENILEVDSGNRRFVSDGYWIFTSPIYSDSELSSFGSCSAGLTKIGVSYSVEVIEKGNSMLELNPK